MTVAAGPALDAALVAIVGGEGVRTGDAARALATDVYRSLAAPDAVVRPRSVAELQAIVRETGQRGIALSVRGGGASYTDGYLPREPGQVLVDLGALDAIEIDEANGLVTVEAGVTWAALRDALAARDLRTPFWGPFSGLVATVGGSVSQNTISHGSGAYGISAESVLSLDVVIADGSILRTGSAATGGLPFHRHFGPDLTGLFTGDCGALGIKARITLPLLRRRPVHEPVSFAFPDFAAMHRAMRRVAAERLEDTHFALDAALSQGQIARQDRAGATWALARSIVKSSPSLLAGLRQVARASRARRAFARAAFMSHYIVEGQSTAETRARVHRIREIATAHGHEIPATVPAVVRGMPFAPLFNTLGPSGERWVPLHGILPHGAAVGFHDALTAFYAARAGELKRLGIWTGGMFAAVGSSGFLYEIAIYWPDAISDYHRAALPADFLAGLTRYPENPEARHAVHRLKSDLIALMVDHGATNFQIGKAYRYATRLQAPALALVRALKAAVDPDGRMSPGALGL